MKVTWDRTAESAYEFQEKVGEGGFGQVWRCIRKEGAPESVAIKRVDSKAQQDVERLLRELKAFERFSNPHIVRLHEVFMDQEAVYLVMDLCTGGDLVQYMQCFQDTPDRIMRKLEFPDQVMGLPTRTIALLLWQMFAGTAYMHHHHFCHRDIKLQNYMIKEPSLFPTVQLVDFGMAVRFHKGKLLQGTMGTLKYMAPEVLKGSYNEKCDIWSIGVVCYILCTERSPWGGKATSQQLPGCILNDLREPWPSCDKPKAVRQLVERMMTRDMHQRPGAKQLLRTSWLKQNGRQSDGDQGPCCTIS